MLKKLTKSWWVIWIKGNRVDIELFVKGYNFLKLSSVVTYGIPCQLLASHSRGESCARTSSRLKLQGRTVLHWTSGNIGFKFAVVLDAVNFGSRFLNFIFFSFGLCFWLFCFSIIVQNVSVWIFVIMWIISFIPIFFSAI